jgi:hypothetical protein
MLSKRAPGCCHWPRNVRELPQALKQAAHEEGRRGGAAMRLCLTLLVVAATGATAATAAADSAGASGARATQEARVCTAGDAPPAGTPVHVMRRVCAPLDAKRIITRCHVEEVGRGEVVRTDGASCAIVRLPAGTRLEPGDAYDATLPFASR